MVSESANVQTTVHATLDAASLRLRMTVDGGVVSAGAPSLGATSRLDFFGELRPRGEVVAGPFQRLVPHQESTFGLWPIWPQTDAGPLAALQAYAKAQGTGPTPLFSLGRRSERAIVQ